MTHLYAIQRDILEFLDDRASADTTAIRRQLAYTADVSVTYDALMPHLNQLEDDGYIESVGADESGATYYRQAESAAVQPQTASD
jgi:DNA-binding PadR family transcriptional regulator